MSLLESWNWCSFLSPWMLKIFEEDIWFRHPNWDIVSSVPVSLLVTSIPRCSNNIFIPHPAVISEIISGSTTKLTETLVFCKHCWGNISCFLGKLSLYSIEIIPALRQRYRTYTIFDEKWSVGKIWIWTARFLVR